MDTHLRHFRPPCSPGTVTTKQSIGEQMDADTTRTRTSHSADRPSVVVGYTPSAAGDAALRLAAREARVRDTRLTIMRSRTDLPPADAVRDDGLNGARRQTAIAQLLALAGHARSGLKIIDVRVSDEPLADQLVDASDTAALVVVGVAASGLPTVATIDSTSRAVVDRARCPVLLVPEGTTDRPPGAIVCGVDRSPASAGALEWASSEARRLGVSLLAVHAPLDPARHHAPGGITWTAWARRLLPVEPVVECAEEPSGTAHRLIDIAAGRNALLVIGSRAHGDHKERAFVHVLTSQTRVPVVVVADQASISGATALSTS
jgi:nucleotide-binding universal stress UspA family protein